MLSGFVIAHTYLDRLGPALRLRPTARFVWARACRIWPAYALVFHLFAIWVVARLVWGSDDRIAFQAVQPVVSLPEYLQQLVLVQLWDAPFFDGASWVGSTWSISAEWLAYLLFPVAALVFHRLRDLPVALLAAGSLALMTPIAWAYLLTGSPYHPWSWAVRVLCGFGAGVLAHLVVRRLQSDGRASERVRRWASALAAALPLAVAAGLVAGELVGPGPGRRGARRLPGAGRGTGAGRPRPGDVAGQAGDGVRGAHLLQPLPRAHPDVRGVLAGAGALPAGARTVHRPGARRRAGGAAGDGAGRRRSCTVSSRSRPGCGSPGCARPGWRPPARPTPRPPGRSCSSPAPVGPVRTGWGSAAVAPHPRHAGGSMHRRIAPGSRTVTVTEYVQRVL